MSVFIDKRYEELDWISQATEPIESPLNDIMSKLPDEFIITDVDTYMSAVGDSWDLDLALSRMISYLMRNNQIPSTLSWAEKEAICSNFDIELVGSPVINFETNTIDGGEIRIFKSVFSVDEDMLKNLMGMNGLRSVRDMYSTDSKYLSRANEILEIMGGQYMAKGLRTKSPKSKRESIYYSLQDLLKNNEWNIKSAELADKIGYWISGYVAHGKLDAITNLCKLKVMTHRGLPIYSMEEV